MLDDTAVRSVVLAYVDALNRRDRDLFLGLFASDAEQADPVGEPARVGIVAIAGWWDAAVMEWERFGIEAREVYVVAGSAALVWTITEQHKGKVRRFTGVDVLNVDDAAKITSVKAYWERRTLGDFA